MRAMFFKMQIFWSEKRYRFFPSQNIYFYDLEWSPQKRHNHRIMSQNDCIMSVLTTCNLLCMRDIALVVGAVLITFFWQKHIWYWFNGKKWVFTYSGRPSRFLTIFDDVLLIQRAVGPGPQRHTTMREN